jgi:hypothetical protein
MEIQLNNQTQKGFRGPGSTASPIDRVMVKKMVQTYRSKYELIVDPFHFSHFGVEEILKLCIDNEVLKPEVLSMIMEAPEGYEGFGLKIYLGNHYDLTTCPTTSKNYEKKNTTILCNTKIKDSKKHLYLDMLTDNKHSVALSTGGYGLDQTAICKPDCAQGQIPIPPDPQDGYDIGT